MSKDKLGIILSLGCLIHCVLMPVILPVLPLFGLAAKHEAAIHIVLAVLVTGVAAVTIIPGYFKHKDLLILILGVLGTTLIIMSGFLEAMGYPTTLLTIAGSWSLIGAHYNNHKKICACEHHHDVEQ